MRDWPHFASQHNVTKDSAEYSGLVFFLVVMIAPSQLTIGHQLKKLLKPARNLPVPAKKRKTKKRLNQVLHLKWEAESAESFLTNCCHCVQRLLFSFSQSCMCCMQVLKSVCNPWSSSWTERLVICSSWPGRFLCIVSLSLEDFLCFPFVAKPGPYKDLYCSCLAAQGLKGFPVLFLCCRFSLLSLLLPSQGLSEISVEY